MDVKRITKSMCLGVDFIFIKIRMRKAATRDKIQLVWWVMEHAPKCVEHMDGEITHDACLPSFYHGTCPRLLNCQVFTSGHFFVLMF